MMKIKKSLMMLAIALGVATTAVARDDYAHDASVLPQAARTTIENNFKKAQVSVVKVEKTLGRVSEYEVILNDGTEITFDRNGNWENVETGRSKSVPAAFIPEAIRKYISSNQPGTRVIGIDKERSGYDVELANGIDMKFDKAGKFIRYDG